MSLLGFGDSQMYFDVRRVTFPASIIPLLYHEGDLFCLVIFGWKTTWAMEEKDMSP